MKRHIGTFCFILAAILIAACFFYYLPKLLDYKASVDLYDDIRNEYTDDPDPEPESETDEELDEISAYLLSIGLDPEKYNCIDIDSEGLLKENEDYIGWIYVPLSDISYPVVKSEDNADYLHTNFQKEYNYAGTIFLDCTCLEGLENRHTILYGHNMRIGTMFAGLNKFREEEYALEHPIFWFITPEEKNCTVYFLSAPQTLMTASNMVSIWLISLLTMNMPTPF